jgi:hypothetical protein
VRLKLSTRHENLIACLDRLCGCDVNDERLVWLIARGDRRAFEDFYFRSAPWLAVRLRRRRTMPPEVQFARDAHAHIDTAYRGLAAGSPTHTSPGVYVDGATYGLDTGHRRSRGPRRSRHPCLRAFRSPPLRSTPALTGGVALSAA